MAGGRNLADQLEATHLSWKGYMDSMPSPCFHADYSAGAPPPDPYQGDSQTPPAKDYADRHNPFLYYPDLIGDDARCQAHVVPYPQLATDIATDSVPAFSFITPDTCHDGHDSTCSDGEPGGLVSADAWLQSNVPPLLDYLTAHNGLLIVTSDEAASSPPPRRRRRPSTSRGGPVSLVVSRRQVLKAGAALGAGLALGDLPLVRRAMAAPALPATGTGAPFDHVIVCMMENRSYDHFLGWLPGTDGIQAGLQFTDDQGITYPTYNLAPDYEGCGYADPDHSWQGGLRQLDGGRLDGFLKNKNPGDT